MRPEYTKENKEKIKRVEEYIGSVRTWSTPSESEIILSWPLEFVESEIGDRRWREAKVVGGLLQSLQTSTLLPAKSSHQIVSFSIHLTIFTLFFLEFFGWF